MPDTRALTLAGFLNAQLDEDEWAARRIHADRCETPAEVTPDSMGRPMAPVCDCDWHIARVLAEADAKRAVVAMHDGSHECPSEGDNCGWWMPDDEDDHHQSLWCPTLRILAQPYRDHPDYQPRWAP